MTLYFTMPICSTICFLVADKTAVVIAAVLAALGVGLIALALAVVIYSK